MLSLDVRTVELLFKACSVEVISDLLRQFVSDWGFVLIRWSGVGFGRCWSSFREKEFAQGLCVSLRLWGSRYFCVGITRVGESVRMMAKGFWSVKV